MEMNPRFCFVYLPAYLVDIELQNLTVSAYSNDFLRQPFG